MVAHRQQVVLWGRHIIGLRDTSTKGDGGQKDQGREYELFIGEYGGGVEGRGGRILGLLVMESTGILTKWENLGCTTLADARSTFS